MPAFDAIPLIDGHLHPPLQHPEAHPFARYFSEASDGESVARHAPNSLFYQWAVKELALLLDCPAIPEAVQEARAGLGLHAYLGLLAGAANVDTLLVDDGYPPAGALSVPELAAAAGCETQRILRIETLAETLLPEAASAEDLADRLVIGLGCEPRPATLKSIIAYRSGLNVAQHERSEVGQEFEAIRSACGARPPRLSSKPLLDFLLLRALEWAAEHDLPVQFHTGYGDRYIDLRQSNPLLLRPVLEHPLFERLKIVLLHASYPFTREASYLAAVYPHVYVDWSEVNPMLPHRQLVRVVEELLALAPFSKLLYGSDAWGIPDWIYLGARAGRSALAEALEGCPAPETIARRILRENAIELYGIGRG